MAEDYSFETIWRFDAPIEMVWEEIKNSGSWHEWWKGVLGVVEIKQGDPDGIGSIHRSSWKSALPYKLEFNSEIVKIVPLATIETRAFGELDGVGVWNFRAIDKNSTEVRYDWKVKTNKAWMNYLAPIAKPFFKWNHDTIMNWGGEGLAKRLNCRFMGS